MKYTLTPEDRAEIEKRFTYQRPHSDQPVRYEAIRNTARDMAILIAECVPPGRERAMALTQLQLAVMCANAGIACGEAADASSTPPAQAT